jgi:antitoxin CptB
MIDCERSRTRWRCRRGLLELDLFLQQFLERDFPHLTKRELAALARLLELPDPELLDYCNGAAQPNDPELQALVDKITAR